MTIHKRVRPIAIATLIALTTFIAAQGSAQACHASCPRYRTITTWEIQKRPVTVYRTLYDHCGRSYRVRQTVYQTVRVPVRRLVRSGY